ncbi:redoxin domain-containing protein [Roseivirga sp. BDSF3-8]|uniref:redoxin domain-containing protein n=1 Tax=Roseivirga sp. BDSF3-8 TaxID=3241598 RepID=UPI003532178F
MKFSAFGLIFDIDPNTMMVYLRRFLSLLLISVACLAFSAAVPAEKPAGEVYVFLFSECPISQKYIPKLNRLNEKYPQIHFTGIFTGWDEPADIEAFKEKYGVEFETMRDEGNKMVEMLDATTTPEVFLFDNEMTALYRGKIDNWYYALGKYRNHTTRHYLDEAISAYLNGEIIETVRTQPVGCLIERNSVCK